MTAVCSTTHAFHYFLTAAADTSEIVREGLRPLSDFPHGERWQQIESAHPRFYERLYDHFARPVLGRPYRNSGVFLTPIDFRAITGHPMARRERLALPIDRLDLADAVVTYESEGERVILPLATDALELVHAEWDEQRVTRWFGVDQNRLFFYVPQIVTYQGRVTVSADDLQPPT